MKNPTLSLLLLAFLIGSGVARTAHATEHPGSTRTDISVSLMPGGGDSGGDDGNDEE